MTKLGMSPTFPFFFGKSGPQAMCILGQRPRNCENSKNTFKQGGKTAEKLRQLALDHVEAQSLSQGGVQRGTKGGLGVAFQPSSAGLAPRAWVREDREERPPADAEISGCR